MSNPWPGAGGQSAAWDKRKPPTQSALPPPPPPSGKKRIVCGIIHIAGPTIIVQPGFMRQRCSWCGAVLIDYDLGRMAVPEGQDPTPASWAVGALVEVDGNMQAVVPHTEGEPLPEGACALLDPEVTR